MKLNKQIALFSIIFIFVDIFAPPTNAATGLEGEINTDCKAVISSFNKIPEYEGKKFVIACKLACSLWEQEKASLTKSAKRLKFDLMLNH